MPWFSSFLCITNVWKYYNRSHTDIEIGHRFLRTYEHVCVYIVQVKFHFVLSCSIGTYWLRNKSKLIHDDVIKWKHFSRNWPFVRGIHPSPVNFPHKDQWRGAVMFSLICVWINDWLNNREAGDLRCNCTHYDIIVMSTTSLYVSFILEIILHALKSHYYKFDND